MKMLLILLIFGILITGCIEKSVNNIENIENKSQDLSEDYTNRENLSTEDWYSYTYEGPPEKNNSENARMAIIPYLRESGWNEGINVVYGSVNDSIIILLPFQLTNNSLDQINQTLSNFSFNPAGLNERTTVNIKRGQDG